MRKERGNAFLEVVAIITLIALAVAVLSTGLQDMDVVPEKDIEDAIEEIDDYSSWIAENLHDNPSIEIERIALLRKELVRMQKYPGKVRSFYWDSPENKDNFHNNEILK